MPAKKETVTEGTPAVVAISEVEAKLVGVLLGTAEVSSLLRSPEAKAIGASLQAKVTPKAENG